MIKKQKINLNNNYLKKCIQNMFFLLNYLIFSLSNPSPTTLSTLCKHWKNVLWISFETRILIT